MLYIYIYRVVVAAVVAAAVVLIVLVVILVPCTCLALVNCMYHPHFFHPEQWWIHVSPWPSGILFVMFRCPNPLGVWLSTVGQTPVHLGRDTLGLRKAVGYLQTWGSFDLLVKFQLQRPQSLWLKDHPFQSFIRDQIICFGIDWFYIKFRGNVCRTLLRQRLEDECDFIFGWVFVLGVWWRILLFSPKHFLVCWYTPKWPVETSTYYCMCCLWLGPVVLEAFKDARSWSRTFSLWPR